MRLAILSDLHSNPFALRAVLTEMASHRPDLVLCLGDVFGYYPWAQETYELLRPLNPIAVRGNHDHLVLQTLGMVASAPKSVPQPSYYEAARLNGLDLAPAARDWLQELPVRHEFTVENCRIQMVHGTPDEPLEGRYYPDDKHIYPWFPGSGEILILGHTHHPLIRSTAGGGMILNPGSVGQPRQGGSEATWLLLDVAGGAACKPQVLRVGYDTLETMNQLARRQWPPRFIAALNKTSPGPLASTNASTAET